jgi:hypothetical protein
MKQSYNYQNTKIMTGLQVLKDEFINLSLLNEAMELTIEEAKQLKSALAVAIDVATHNAEQK